jgi:hypothetical protein
MGCLIEQRIAPSRFVGVARREKEEERVEEKREGWQQTAELLYPVVRLVGQRKDGVATELSL